VLLSNFAVSLLLIAAGAVAGWLLTRVFLMRRAEHAAALARAQTVAELGERETALRTRLVEAETRLEEERRRADEKVALLQEAEAKLGDAFSRLAGRALEANAESFLRQAKQSFETLQATAQGELEQRKQAIEGLLAPIKDQLGRYESGLRDLEKARQVAYGSISEQIKGLLTSQDGLLRETGKLVTALRRPEVRGSWGEMHLRRAVEFAGMLEYVDFTAQVTVDGDDGRLRPDLVVHLPGGKSVVVDAKAPLDAYLAAVEATTDEAREAALKRHARQVRNHLDRLSGKAYWKQFDEAPDFVVLFLPGDAFFSAALEQDSALIEDSFKQNVLITTPSTLVALLKTVHYGWRQEAIARDARAIHAAASTLYDRIRVFTEHFARIGKGLDDAVNAYNAAVGSYERSVLPQGRRIERLGATKERVLAEPERIEHARRDLPASGAAENDDGEDAAAADGDPDA